MKYKCDPIPELSNSTEIEFIELNENYSIFKLSNGIKNFTLKVQNSQIRRNLSSIEFNFILRNKPIKFVAVKIESQEDSDFFSHAKYDKYMDSNFYASLNKNFKKIFH